jgi:hypothetical protein
VESTAQTSSFSRRAMRSRNSSILCCANGMMFFR